MSSVLPAKSTRVGALDSMIMNFHYRDLQSMRTSQFAGIGLQAQAEMTARTDKLTSDARRELVPRAASRGGAIANHELRACVLFFLGQRGIRFEAAAAAGFIHSACANDDQLFALHQPLRMHGGIAAPHANSQQL